MKKHAETIVSFSPIRTTIYILYRQ